VADQWQRRRSNYERQGVAPAVKFVALKVLDAQGQHDDMVIKAIDTSSLTPTLRVKVINLSPVTPIRRRSSTVVRRARSGRIVVSSQLAGWVDQNGDGESGYTGINSPANAPSSIAVGAVDTKNSITRDGDAVAAFSSRGPTWFDALAKPDVVAPGVHLVSNTDTSSYLYTNLPNNRQTVNGHPMLDLTGTSMAAPIAAGVAALVLDANGALMPNAVKAIVEYTAIRLPGADYLTQGAGEVNAGGAVALASAIDTRARMNSWWLASGVPGYTTIGGVQNPWSGIIIWDNAVLGGQMILLQEHHLGHQHLWGTHNRLWTRNIIWGRTSSGAPGAIVKNRDVVLGRVRRRQHHLGHASRLGESRHRPDAKGKNIIWGTSTTTTSSGAPWTTTTSSGAPTMIKTTSSGARGTARTTSSGARPGAEALSAARPTTMTTSSGARPTTTTSCGAPSWISTTSSGARRPQCWGHGNGHRIGIRVVSVSRCPFGQAGAEALRPRLAHRSPGSPGSGRCPSRAACVRCAGAPDRVRLA
jgi:hypothetical protein